MTEVKMVGWHNRLNGHEFEQALGVCDGQGSLACCSPESDMDEQLNCTDLKLIKQKIHWIHNSRMRIISFQH